MQRDFNINRNTRLDAEEVYVNKRRLERMALNLTHQRLERLSHPLNLEAHNRILSADRVKKILCLMCIQRQMHGAQFPSIQDSWDPALLT
jgi:hypothetical protein